MNLETLYKTGNYFEEDKEDNYDLDIIAGHLTLLKTLFIDAKKPVLESVGICKYIEERESCESRQYIDGFATYSKEVVLGNGECMSCWDESADLAFPLAQEYGFEETLIAAG